MLFKRKVIFFVDVPKTTVVFLSESLFLIARGAGAVVSCGQTIEQGVLFHFSREIQKTRISQTSGRV